MKKKKIIKKLLGVLALFFVFGSSGFLNIRNVGTQDITTTFKTMMSKNDRMKNLLKFFRFPKAFGVDPFRNFVNPHVGRWNLPATDSFITYYNATEQVSEESINHLLFDYQSRIADMSALSIRPTVALVTSRRRWSLDEWREIARARCAEDRLNTDQAKQRNAWTKNCNTELGWGISEADLIGLEYDRNGNSRALPKYYIITTQDNQGNLKTWKAPTRQNDACVTPDSGNPQPAITCESFRRPRDCFTSHQVVKFEHGFIPIIDAYQSNESDVMVLKESSTLDKPEWKSVDVDSYTESQVDTSQNIFVIRTSNEKLLEVTPNHPFIRGNGYLVEASRLEVGDSLVTENGESEEINSIQEVPFQGKVYNLSPAKSESENSINPKNQILSVQGFLSGSAGFERQDYYSYVGTQLLIPDIILADVTDEVTQSERD